LGTDKKNALVAVSSFLAVMILLVIADGSLVAFYIFAYHLSVEGALISSTRPVIIVNEVLFAAMALLIAFKISRWSREDLGLTRQGPLSNTLLGILVGGAGYVAAAALLYLMNLFVPIEVPSWFVEMLKPKDALDLAVFLALTWILIGPCEELFFRGLVQGSITRWRGSKAGIVAGAALFGVAHFDPSLWFRIPATVLLGLVYGVVCDRRRSLFPAAVAHALNDSIAFILSSLI